MPDLMNPQLIQEEAELHLEQLEMPPIPDAAQSLTGAAAEIAFDGLFIAGALKGVARILSSCGGIFGNPKDDRNV